MPPPRSTSPAAARAGGAFSPDTETDPHPTTHINTDYILASLDLILTARPPGLEHVARLQSHADLAKLQRLQAKQIRALATAIRRARARTKSPAEKSKVQAMAIRDVVWEDLPLFGIKADKEIMTSPLFGWFTTDNGPVWKLDEEENHPTSDWLRQGLAMVRQAVKTSNEACIRLMIDLILLEATSSPPWSDSAPPTSPSQPPKTPPNHPRPKSRQPRSQPRRAPPQVTAQHITLAAEQHLTFTATVSPLERIKFTGRADYVLGYHVPRVKARNNPLHHMHASAGFLVVVEAKHKDWQDGVCQCLAYIGIIHNSRKATAKVNSTVFGVVSNGPQWVFLRVDNDGEATRSQLYDMTIHGHLESVVSFLRGVLRVAAHSSPTTSPTSRFLQQFRNAQAKKKWDFGLSTVPSVRTEQELRDSGEQIIDVPAYESLLGSLELGESEDEDEEVRGGEGGQEEEEEEEEPEEDEEEEENEENEDEDAEGVIAKVQFSDWESE